MTRCLVRRLLYFVPALFLVTVVVFLIMALAVLTANPLTDLLDAHVDPRIRYAQPGARPG
jgi:ABC-type dipeptide/oligopeptide/nickel transport system permease component